MGKRPATNKQQSSKKTKTRPKLGPSVAPKHISTTRMTMDEKIEYFIVVAGCLLHVLRGEGSDKICYRTAANLECGGAYRFIDLAYKDPSISRAESDKRFRAARLMEERLPALRKYKTCFRKPVPPPMPGATGA